MYDHEADPDVPGVKSVSVGDNFPAKLAKDATSLFNTLAKKLDDLDPLP